MFSTTFLISSKAQKPNQQGIVLPCRPGLFPSKVRELSAPSKEAFQSSLYVNQKINSPYDAYAIMLTFLKSTGTCCLSSHQSFYHCGGVKVVCNCGGVQEPHFFKQRQNVFNRQTAPYQTTTARRGVLQTSC